VASGQWSVVSKNGRMAIADLDHHSPVFFITRLFDPISGRIESEPDACAEHNPMKERGTADEG
jgi:hypothetical protein